MDNNPVAQTPVPTPPAPVSPQPTGENKMILWLVLGLVAVVVIVGGFYLLMARQKQESSITPSPSPVQEDLEKQLNSVNIEDVESDFAPVDQDLQNL